MEVEWNKDGFREMQTNIQRVLNDVAVPIEGIEEEAIADGKSQMIAKGIEPNDEGVAGYVRQARQG